jgi:YbbR domain-containing protein
MKSIFKRLNNNLGLKVAALFFAVLIWSFVISVADPPRSRTLSNIPLRIVGLTGIEEAGLIVRNEEAFAAVSMVVDVKISETNRLNLGAVQVTADLSAIQRKGVYEIYLSGQSLVGDVVSVTPSVITLDVDERTTREIPVSYAYEGQLDARFHRTEPTLSISTIEITGAQADVEKVTSAVCLINLSRTSESINSSYTLKLVDKDNVEIPADRFVDPLPVVTVKMDVFYKRTLDIASDPQLCIEDISAIADGYMITNISFSQANITVYGTRDVIAALAPTVAIRPVSVDGLRATKTFEVEVLLPEGIQQLSHTPIHMTVTVAKAQP